MRPRRRRWLRRVLLGFALTLVTLVIVVIALRLYFNDERLRGIFEGALSERTGTDVTLERLELRLFSGLALEGLRVGPPAGFEHDVLAVERIAVEYDFWALFGWVAHIERVEVLGIEPTYEQHEDGETNVAAILAHAVPMPETLPPPQTPTPEPEEPERPLPALPTLPLEIRVDSVVLGPLDATVVQPGQRLTLSGYRLEASFAGVDDGYDLTLWTGLGERDPKGRGSNLVLERDGRVAIDSAQRLGLYLSFEGYRSIDASLRWEGLTDANAPIDAPPTRSSVALDLRANLIEQTAEISTLTLSVGDSTELKATARATALLSDPTLTIDSLAFDAVLDEIEPIGAAVMPSLEMGGTVHAKVEETSVTASRATSSLDTGAEVEVESVRGAFGPHRARGLTGRVRVDVTADKARAEGTLDLDSARSGAFEISRAHLELEAETAVSRWLAAVDAPADPEAQLSADASLQLASVSAPGLSLSGLATTARVRGPVDLARERTSDDPLRVVLDQRVARITTAGQRVTTLRMRSDTKLFDLAANGVDSDTTLTVASIQSQVGDSTIELPTLSSHVVFSRRGQRIRAPVLSARVGDDFSLEGKLDADRVFSSTPSLATAELFVSPFDLERALALLPPAMRPPQQLRGTVGLDASLRGRIPIATLTRAATPPTLGTTLAESLDGVGTTLEGLASLFEQGLPFTGQLSFELNDAAMDDSALNLTGLSVDLDLNVLETGPRFELAMLLAKLSGPSEIANLSLQGALGFEGRTLGTSGVLELGSASGPGLPSPVRNATGNWRMSYEVGGALALERLEVLAPDRDGRLYSSFIIQEPLKVLRDRRYAREGMPGVDVAARVESSLRIDESAPIEVPGQELDGGFGLNGELRISDGLIDLTGVAFADHLSLQNAAAVVTDVDGGIPFDLRFATSDRDGFVAMPQPVLFGDGILRIGVKSGVRIASARPLYYSRLRRYLAGRGVKARRIESKGFLIEHLEIDGGIRDAAVVAERARLTVLGGDIDGSMSMGIRGERSVAGTMDMKISNIDASYFPALDLEPGRDSEVDADASIQFAFSQNRRDLTANMNVTRISTTALDRFLQLLDPEEQNQSIQGTRFWLNLAQINGVAMWLAYENLNMDLDANSIIKIPFTSVGFPSFERELLRREPMGERLDIMLDPVVERIFGPLVGITRGR